MEEKDFMKMDLENALLRESYFGRDLKRINHARHVLGYAVELFSKDKEVATASAILHESGIHEAERKYGNTAGRFQEIEGQAIARRMTGKAGMQKQKIEEVCGIAHHHNLGKVNTRNFGILYDANWLVNLGDEYDIKDGRKLAKVIEKVFLTEAGKK